MWWSDRTASQLQGAPPSSTQQSIPHHLHIVRFVDCTALRSCLLLVVVAVCRSSQKASEALQDKLSVITQELDATRVELSTTQEKLQAHIATVNANVNQAVQIQSDEEAARCVQAALVGVSVCVCLCPREAVQTRLWCRDDCVGLLFHLDSG
jgi:hypothetical protein